MKMENNTFLNSPEISRLPRTDLFAGDTMQSMLVTLNGWLERDGYAERFSLKYIAPRFDPFASTPVFCLACPSDSNNDISIMFLSIELGAARLAVCETTLLGGTFARILEDSRADTEDASMGALPPLYREIRLTLENRLIIITAPPKTADGIRTVIGTLELPRPIAEIGTDAHRYSKKDSAFVAKRGTDIRTWSGRLTRGQKLYATALAVTKNRRLKEEAVELFINNTFNEKAERVLWTGKLTRGAISATVFGYWIAAMIMLGGLSCFGLFGGSLLFFILLATAGVVSLSLLPAFVRSAKRVRMVVTNLRMISVDGDTKLWTWYKDIKSISQHKNEAKISLRHKVKGGIANFDGVVDCASAAAIANGCLKAQNALAAERMERYDAAGDQAKFLAALGAVETIVGKSNIYLLILTPPEIVPGSETADIADFVMTDPPAYELAAKLASEYRKLSEITAALGAQNYLVLAQGILKQYALNQSNPSDQPPADKIF